MARVTKLSVEELAISAALFGLLGGHKLAQVKKSLDVTQQAALSEAWRLLKNQHKLLEQLKTSPEKLSQGSFTLQEGSPFLRKLSGKLGWGSSKKNKEQDSLEP